MTRERDALPRFNRYSIPARPGTVECRLCPAMVKPEGMADHMRAKHPAPYPFCHTPDQCAGLGYCPREIACND